MGKVLCGVSVNHLKPWCVTCIGVFSLDPSFPVWFSDYRARKPFSALFHNQWAVENRQIQLLPATSFGQKRDSPYGSSPSEETRESLLKPANDRRLETEVWALQRRDYPLCKLFLTHLYNHNHSCT